MDARSAIMLDAASGNVVQVAPAANQLSAGNVDEGDDTDHI